MSLAEAWIDRLPAAVRSAWADAIPDALVQLWWAEGDRPRVYAVCGWSSRFGARTGMAAWFAALDPDPASPDVTQVVRSVLGRDARYDPCALPSLAFVPLSSEATIRRAEAFVHLDRERNAVLRRRLSATPEALRADPTSDRPEVRALQLGVSAARLGDKELLAAAWAEAEYDPHVGRFLLVPTHALGAWDLVPVSAYDQRPWAQFLGGRAALKADDREEAVARAALGVRPMPDDWKATLEALGSDEIATRFDEGLISPDERACLTLAKALGAPRALHAAAIALLTDAHGAPLGFADEVAQRRAGTWNGDRVDVARRTVDALRKKLQGGEPARGNDLYKMTRSVERLADVGAKDLPEVIAAFAPHLPEYDRERFDVFIPGRALSVLEATESGFAVADPRLAQALVRDGHPAEAARVVERLLGEAIDAQALALLAPVIDALAPDQSGALAPAIGEAIGDLPAASADAANAWLMGDPDD